MSLIIMKSSLPNIQKNLKGDKAKEMNSLTFEDKGDYLKEIITIKNQ